MRKCRTFAVLGVVAVTIATGSTAAQARPASTPLTWTPTPVKHQPAILDDVDANAAGTWAVGSDLIDDFQDQRPFAVQWIGGHWKTTPQPMRTNSTLTSVAVAGGKNVWAVGLDRADPAQPKPLVLHWNGSAWRVVPGPAVPTGSFDEVTIGPGGAPWVAGWASVDGVERAVVYRYAGGSWQALNAGLENSINGNALTVIAKNDAWLGLNAGLAHFDGKSWKLVKEVPSDGSQIPTALVAAGPKDVWAVGVEHGGGPLGERPLALHFDGVSWNRIATPAGGAQLYDVALRNNRPVAVGESLQEVGNTIVSKPIVLDFNGSSFVKAKSPTTAEGTLTGADAAGGKLWTVGLTNLPTYAAFAAFSK
ncbi:hypothetical protein F1D05_16405 [Kribbella qitaiheensis]|uniref:Exo-alpha-sialidase n=1 Tax=Kribbella qitaiheensis TaxID=1544730 RepID=A0A7G6WYZ0_9ACTN|nr:hypothetical protein [Kribbella qitaiheensis]QNE19205.1 hypothetical protein F1D05_16405 [Kribbella qitaiheensis]